MSENFAYRYHSYHAGHQARYEILLGMDCFTKGRVQKKKKIVDWSTKGWVGGSGGGQNPLKKNKKTCL